MYPGKYLCANINIHGLQPVKKGILAFTKDITLFFPIVSNFTAGWRRIRNYVFLLFIELA